MGSDGVAIIVLARTRADSSNSPRQRYNRICILMANQEVGLPFLMLRSKERWPAQVDHCDRAIEVANTNEPCFVFNNSYATLNLKDSTPISDNAQHVRETLPRGSITKGRYLVPGRTATLSSRVSSLPPSASAARPDCAAFNRYTRRSPDFRSTTHSNDSGAT